MVLLWCFWVGFCGAFFCQSWDFVGFGYFGLKSHLSMRKCRFAKCDMARNMANVDCHAIFDKIFFYKIRSQ